MAETSVPPQIVLGLLIWGSGRRLTLRIPPPGLRLGVGHSQGPLAGTPGTPGAARAGPAISFAWEHQSLATVLTEGMGRCPSALDLRRSVEVGVAYLPLVGRQPYLAQESQGLAPALASGMEGSCSYLPNFTQVGEGRHGSLLSDFSLTLSQLPGHSCDDATGTEEVLTLPAITVGRDTLPMDVNCDAAGTSPLQLLWAITGCGVGFLFLDRICRWLSTLITWGCPSTPQYPSLLRRRVTVPRLLGGARSYAKLIINGAKGPSQELNDFFRKEAHHLKKHFPARVEEDSPGVFAAFFRNESELRLFTSDFPSGQYSWKGEPLTFNGGAKRGSNNSPPQVSARNTKKPKYAPAASASAPAVGSGTLVQWVWISHQAAQGRTLVEVCSLFGRPLKTAAGTRIIGKGAAAASPAPGTFVCFGSKRAALRLIQCSCKRSLLSVPDTDEPLVELSVVPPAPHTFLSLKSATPESEVLTISGDGWRNLDSSYIRSFFLPEDDRCSVSRTATGYSVAFPSLSSLQQFFKVEVVPLSSEVFQWQFNQVVLTVGFKGSALDITLGHRMPASGRRPVVSQWFPPRYGGVNLKGFVYPELRLPAWRGEFPVYMIREATIGAIGSVTQYLGVGQPRNATVLVPVSMSATLVRLLSESLYGIQITPEIFAPLCVKTLPTPRKGDAELGKFRIFYLSVIPAPPYSLLRVENSFTGSWGCPRLDAAGNYSRWLCSAIANLALKWVGIFPVRSSLSTWTGASPLWTMLGNWVGPTQTRTLISNTWHAGLTNGTILFASEAGQAQLWKQLSSDWGKKFQVQLIHVKDGTSCYEVATPAMGFTFPSYYEIMAMQTVELQVLDHTLKFGAPGRLGLAIIAHSLSLIGIDCRSSDVALYAKEDVEVSSLREFFLKDSSQDSDEELAAVSMAESLTSWPDQSTLEEDLFACSTPLIRPRAVKGDLESFATWAGCQLHPALRASCESPSPVEVMSAPSFSELSEGSPYTGEAKVTPPTGNSRVISHIFRPSDSAASGPPDSSGVGLSLSTPKSSAVEPVAANNKSVYPSPLFSVTFHDPWASKDVNAARMKALTALPLDSLSCEFIFQDPILPWSAIYWARGTLPCLFGATRAYLWTSSARSVNGQTANTLFNVYGFAAL